MSADLGTNSEPTKYVSANIGKTVKFYLAGYTTMPLGSYIIPSYHNQRQGQTDRIIIPLRKNTMIVFSTDTTSVVSCLCAVGKLY